MWKAVISGSVAEYGIHWDEFYSLKKLRRIVHALTLHLPSGCNTAMVDCFDVK